MVPSQPTALTAATLRLTPAPSYSASTDYKAPDYTAPNYKAPDYKVVATAAAVVADAVKDG